MSLTPALVEKTAPDFDIRKIQSAREKTWKVLHEMVRRIEPGMTEKEGLEIGKQVFAEMGAEKFWHRTYVRMEGDTLKKYGEPMTSNLQLTKDGIYFIDIGPVFDGYEGDAGMTIVMGDDPQKKKCADDCQAIFEIVAAEWKRSGRSGKDLYDFAADEARKKGWQLNLDIAGHRLSDFPHAAYHKGNIRALDFKPSAGVWVLEIQIRHPDLPYGAFFEDVLI